MSESNGNGNGNGKGIAAAANSVAGITIARLSSIVTPVLLSLIAFFMVDMKSNFEQAIEQLLSDVRRITVDVTRIDAEQTAQDRRLDVHDVQLDRINDRIYGPPPAN